MGRSDRQNGASSGVSEGLADTFGKNELTYYLVSRFIVVLLCVMVAEMAIIWIESTLFLPFLAPMVSSAASQAGLGTTSLSALIKWLFTIITAMMDVGHAQLFDLVARSFAALLIVVMMLLLAMPLLAGALVFAYLVVRKVRTLQAQREEELARQERQRNQFITDVAHDLRTPLMAISGMSHALADGLVRTEEMRAEYLHSICEKSDAMGSLVASVFDYTKLGSEGFSLQVETVNLPDMLLR